MEEENSKEAQEQCESETGGCRINKKLIALKLTLFFLYGATSSLTPYLPIHMQSIGLSIEEIGMIYLALPFTTFLAPPLTGFLVDKFGKYKLVVIVSFVLTSVLHHTLIFIPPQETPGVVPPGYILTHPKKMYVEVWWSPCPSKECPEEEELDVVLDLCVDHCLFRMNRKNKFNRDDASNTAIDVGHDDDLEFRVSTKNSTQFRLELDMHPHLGDPIEQFGMEMELPEDDDVTDISKRFKSKLLKKFGVDVQELEENDLRCGGKVSSAEERSSNLLKDFSTDCILQKCNFRAGGPGQCPPDYKESDDKVFWLYFFLRFMANIMMTAGVTIMDPIALSLVEKYNGDFGKEKLFSSLGMALFSPIVGVLIDYNSERLGYTDYSAAFYTYDVLMFLAAIMVLMLPLENKLPADNIFRDLLKVFKLRDTLFFMFFLFILGNLWGFIESYLFFYLRDLGAPNYLLGITVTVGTISSLPFLYGAEEITRRLGHVNVIIIAFFAHAGRLVGYSVIENAWWCFPFESLEAVSVHLMWVAAATYCAILAPPHLLATLIGVLGMSHFSIGRGSGSFVGGHIIGKFGVRQAFKLMGMVGVVSGFLYGLIHYKWLRKTEKKRSHFKDELYMVKDGEPKFKDQGTMVNFERLSLVIEYNQIGSLTSLYRYRNSLEQPRFLRRRSNSTRRDSLSTDAYRSSRGSTSKNDLLKSAFEVSKSKASNGLLSHHNAATSIEKLNYDQKIPSAPRLYQRSLSLTPNDKLHKLITKEDPNQATTPYQSEDEEKNVAISNYFKENMDSGRNTNKEDEEKCQTPL